MTDEKRKYAAVLSKFFGKKPGQTLMEFASEVNALTQKDKDDLYDGIENGSLTY